MSDSIRTIGIIDYKCPYCNHNKSYVKMYLEYTEFGECMACGKKTYRKILKTLDLNSKPSVECPYCHSTNTKKISTTSKVGSVALFGIFAVGKVSKQWHCNNCKSDF